MGTLRYSKNMTDADSRKVLAEKFQKQK